MFRSKFTLNNMVMKAAVHPSQWSSMARNSSVGAFLSISKLLILANAVAEATQV